MMSRFWILLILGASVLVTGASFSRADDGLIESPDGPEHVKTYLTQDEALAKVFKKADRTWSEPWTPTPEQRDAMEARLGLRLREESFQFHRARKGDQDLGWALILEERGRFKPITFLVHMGPDRKVTKVLVLIYRESRGAGVHRQRFLKQFRGRDEGSGFRLNRDIKNLSGATLSSRALTTGVRRALVALDEAYPRGQAAP